MKRTLSKDEVRGLIRAAAERAGSQAALAQEWGVSGAYICDILAGTKNPGPKVLAPLGLTETEQSYIYTAEHK